MRRIFSLALLALVGLAAPSWAGCWWGCCPCCKPIPEQEQPCCGCPCEHRMHLCLFGPEHAQQYIETLQCCDSTCCDRIEACEKLGCRLHADFCCDPCVLEALLAALRCDKCWEVRKAAAWAIFTQDAETDEAVMALYISSKADSHYEVRARAAEALDILTLCCSCRYKEMYKVGDFIVKELKKKSYKPGMEDCCKIVAEAYVTGPEEYQKSLVKEAEDKAKKAAEDAKKAGLPVPETAPKTAPKTTPAPTATPPAPMPKATLLDQPAPDFAAQPGAILSQPLPNGGR